MGSDQKISCDVRLVDAGDIRMSADEAASMKKAADQIGREIALRNEIGDITYTLPEDRLRELLSYAKTLPRKAKGS